MYNNIVNLAQKAFCVTPTVFERVSELPTAGFKPKASVAYMKLLGPHLCILLCWKEENLVVPGKFHSSLSSFIYCL